MRTERLDFNDIDADGLALLDEAATALAGTGTGVEARVSARLAVVGYHVRPGRRVELADRAVAVARRAADADALAHVLSARLYVRWGAEPPEVVRPIADEIVALAERSSDRERVVDGRLWRLVALLEQGELAEAEREVHAVDREAEALRQPLHRLLAASRRSTLALLRGRPAEALELARRAREIGERGREPDAGAVYWTQAYAVWQDIDIPQPDLDRAERILRELVAGSPLSFAHTAGLVLLCLGTGRADEARAHYDGIVRQDPASHPPDMVRVWGLTQFALAAVTFGDAETAARLHAALLPSAGRCAVAAGAVACSGAVDHYLGLLAGCAGRAGEAVAHLERAVALHGRMGAPGLLARSRAALAAALRAHDPAAGGRAAALEDDSRTVAARLGLTRLAAQLAPAPAPAGRPRLVREGELWAVHCDGRVAHVRHLTGMAYLSALLDAPGREVSALDLAAMRHGPCPGPVDRDAGLQADAVAGGDEILDARARTAYRARLAELRREHAEAQQWHDTERAARLAVEIDFLARELGAALGLAGRPRRTAGAAERARISVTRALRAAIRRVADVDSAAGEHLAAAVRTGTFCCYHPERDARCGGRQRGRLTVS